MRGGLPRRAFLGGLAGTVLVGCQRPESAVIPSPSSTPPPSTSEPVSWSRLADALDGELLLPSDTGYPAAKAVFNTRYAGATPAAVVVPASEDDVRRAMEFAADRGIGVAPRSGGHSYVGASASSGTLVIDLRPLATGVDHDDRTAVAAIPAATTLDTVQTALAAVGRSIPSGSCPTVGVAGLTLGGGLGADTREAGLTCDGLVAATVVLPGGDRVTAGPEDHADLFWALRGGGGGNFGVTTAFSMRTRPAPDRDVVTVGFPSSAVEAVILHASDWLEGAPRTTWGMVNVPVGQGASGCRVVLATAAGSGPSQAADLLAAVGMMPTSRNVRTLGRLDFVRYFAGGPDAARPRGFLAGSDVIGTLTPDAARAIVAATRDWPGGEGGGTAVIESLTGAVQDLAPAETAFPWRRQAACIQWYTEPTGAEELATATAWLAAAHAAVREHSVGGYVNYVEPDSPAHRYFGTNTDRLAAVRGRYDPNRVMSSGLPY